jgi:hypothetical protein
MPHAGIVCTFLPAAKSETHSFCSKSAETSSSPRPSPHERSESHWVRFSFLRQCSTFSCPLSGLFVCRRGCPVKRTVHVPMVRPQSRLRKAEHFRRAALTQSTLLAPLSHRSFTLRPSIAPDLVQVGDTSSSLRGTYATVPQRSCLCATRTPRGRCRGLVASLFVRTFPGCAVRQETSARLASVGRPPALSVVSLPHGVLSRTDRGHTHNKGMPRE